MVSTVVDRGPLDVFARRLKLLVFGWGLAASMLKTSDSGEGAYTNKQKSFYNLFETETKKQWYKIHTWSLPLTEGGEIGGGISPSIRSFDPQLEWSKAGTSLNFWDKGTGDNPAYLIKSFIRMIKQRKIRSTKQKLNTNKHIKVW
jgi:hypothetical protein